MVLMAALAWGQTQDTPGQVNQPQGTKSQATQKPEQKPGQKDDIPDAPSAVRPPLPFPSTPPGSAPEAPLPASSEPPSSQPTAAPPSTPGEPPQPAPPLNIKTVPQGGATQGHEGSSDELFKITRNVNQVLVPVRVTGDSGRMVDGLVYIRLRCRRP
jgi:hypothetical protein